MIRPGSRLAPRAARVSRAALVTAGLAATVALAGCAAGQVAQTASQANASTGASVTMNGIAIRQAQITFSERAGGSDSAAIYRAGGSAPVEMYIINEGTQPDRLVSISSPVASTVAVSGTTDLPAGTVLIVGGGSEGAAAATAEPTAGAAAEPTAGATAAPTATVAPTAAPASAEGPAAVPTALAEVSPSTRFAQVQLTGLREDIRAGLSYEVVLTFERAGQIPVRLPVGYPSLPREAAE